MAKYEALYTGNAPSCKGCQRGIWKEIATDPEAVSLSRTLDFMVREIGTTDKFLVPASNGQIVTMPTPRKALELSPVSSLPTGRLRGVEVKHDEGYVPSTDPGDLPPAGLPIEADGTRQVLKNLPSQRMSQADVQELKEMRVDVREIGGASIDTKRLDVDVHDQYKKARPGMRGF